MKTFFSWLIFEGLFARVLIGIVLVGPKEHLETLILASTAIILAETIASAVLLSNVVRFERIGDGRQYR